MVVFLICTEITSKYIALHELFSYMVLCLIGKYRRRRFIRCWNFRYPAKGCTFRNEVLPPANHREGGTNLRFVLNFALCNLFGKSDHYSGNSLKIFLDFFELFLLFWTPLFCSPFFMSTLKPYGGYMYIMFLYPRGAHQIGTCPRLLSSIPSFKIVCNVHLVLHWWAKGVYHIYSHVLL